MNQDDYRRFEANYPTASCLIRLGALGVVLLIALGLIVLALVILIREACSP